MNLATMAMKQFRAEGRLQDLDVSEEINACSIRVDADIDGRTRALAFDVQERDSQPPD